MPPPRELGSRTGRIRRSLRKLLFGLGTAGLFVIGLDWGVGCYFRGTPEGSLMMDDGALFYRLRPGEDVRSRIGRNTPAEWRDSAPLVRVRINADGYRGPRVERLKSAGEYRIVCMGDSITMGMDVEDDETYPARLERLLRERHPGRKITVINGGVLGYSSRQGLYLFKDIFEGYSPDLVIWGYGFNDQARMSFLDRSDVTLVPIGPGAQPAGATLKRRALFWAFSRPTVQVVRLLISPLWWRTKAIGLMLEIQDHDKAAAYALTEADFQKSRVPPRDYGVHLLEMDALAREGRFKLMLVTFFGTSEVYRETARRFSESHRAPYVDFNAAFGRIFQTRSLAGNPQDEKLFDQRYRPFLEPGVLDTQPMFYLTTDNLHPNAIGQRIIAETLAPALDPLIADRP